MFVNKGLHAPYFVLWCWKHQPTISSNGYGYVYVFLHLFFFFVVSFFSLLLSFVWIFCCSFEHRFCLSVTLSWRFSSLCQFVIGPCYVALHMIAREVIELCTSKIDLALTCFCIRIPSDHEVPNKYTSSVWARTNTVFGREWQQNNNSVEYKEEEEGERKKELRHVWWVYICAAYGSEVLFFCCQNEQIKQNEIIHTHANRSQS